MFLSRFLGSEFDGCQSLETDKSSPKRVVGGNRLERKCKTRKLSQLVQEPEMAEGYSGTKAFSLCLVNMMEHKAQDKGKTEKKKPLKTQNLYTISRGRITIRQKNSCIMQQKRENGNIVINA